MASLLLSAFCAGALVAAEAGLAVRDCEGTEHRLLETDGKRPTVLIFVSLDCPIANQFAPEIGRIHEKYSALGVDLFLVHAEADVSAAEAKKHAQDFGYRCPVLLDPKHVLVKRAEATTTPEAAVFSADGILKYHGRINDIYADLGKMRQAPTQHDLREAIDAVLAGKPVKSAYTAAVGCAIPVMASEVKK